MPRSSLSVSASVKRGPESWTFIYVFLGFALSIEGTTIGLIAPLVFPWNVVVYAIVAAVTFWLFIESGKFQDKLIGMKNRYENRAR